MQESSSDFLTRAVGYVVGFLATGGLLGLLQYKLAARRAPADNSLARAQTAEIRAKIRREDESAEFGRMRELAQEARADVVRLRGERDAADARVGQLLIERRERDEQIARLGEQLKLAEEQLGLKARAEDKGN